MREEFHEIQQFRQWWFWLVMSLVTAGVFAGNAVAFYQQVIHGQPFGDKPLHDTGLIFMMIFSGTIMTLILLLLYHSKMEVKVERYGISYRYFPFIRSWRFIAKDEIKDWTVKRYIPSGYGIRFGFRFRTLNVSGFYGLELVRHEKRNLRLGTQKPEELKKAMERLFNPEEK
jgi:hypothetical protein